MDGPSDRLRLIETPVELPERLRHVANEGGLYGREPELEAIVRALADARPGVPRIVCLSGPAGRGRTRLVAEAAQRAAAAGHRVFYGVSDRDADRAGQAITDAIRRPALWEERALLVVLEDLHFADRATLNMLRYVTANLDAPRAAFVLTYRENQVRDELGLMRALAESERRGWVTRLTLRLLDAAEVAAMMRDAGVEGDAEALQARANGNPYAVREILGTGVDGGAPPGMRALIDDFLRQMGEPADRVFALLALGADGDPAVLALALDVPPERVVAVLDVAERVGLLTPAGRLVAPIVAECVLAGLSRACRGDLHRRLAAHEPDPVRRAEHWRAAVPRDAAAFLASALGAARVLCGRGDVAGAAGWFACALELAGDDAATRSEALIGLGEALSGAGDPGHREVLLEGARLADQRGDRSALVRATLANHQGMAAVVGRADPERIAMLEAALEAVGEVDSPERALLLTSLGAEAYFAPGALERSARLGDEAVAMARRLGDRAILASVLSPRVSRWTPAAMDDQEAGTAEAVSLADRVGDPRLQCRALRWRTASLLLGGRALEAREAARRHLDLGERHGDAFAVWLATQDLGTVELVAGRLDLAEALATEALALGAGAGREDARVFHANAMFAVRYEQGRLAELADVLSARLERGTRPALVRPGLTLTLLAAGDREAAAEVFAAEAGTGFTGLPADIRWLAGTVMLGHAAAGLEDGDAAATLYAQLMPWSGRLAWNSSVFGTVDLALARLAALLPGGRVEEHRARHREVAARCGASRWAERV